jgi:hypothetical protein
MAWEVDRGTAKLRQPLTIAPLVVPTNHEVI